MVRPEFFEDEVMGTLSIETRFVYVGLWVLCDDAGYFEASVRRIAATLFRYEDVGPREHRVTVALEELAKASRLNLLGCDVHGLIPSIPRWKVQGGNHSKALEKRHATDCQKAGVRTRTSESSSESVSESVSVSESGSDSLHEAAMAAGGFAAQVASRPRSKAS